MKKYESNGLVFFKFSHLEKLKDIEHGISSRLGGVSRGRYKELNLGLHVGDDDNRVRTNRRRFCAAAGGDPKKLTCGRQSHSANVAVIEENDAGRGAFDYGESIPDIDALVTDVPGITLMVLVADCVPILIFDPVKKTAAVVHGSWRGTLQGIAGKTIEAMAGEFGCAGRDLLAGIGPSIGPCCYEVGKETAGLFKETWPESASRFIQRTGEQKMKLDLWKANHMQLLSAGVREEHIEEARMCTSCRPDVFYSYRAENGKTGRYAGLIMIV